MVSRPCRSGTQADTRTKLLNRLGFIQEHHPSLVGKSSSSLTGNCQEPGSTSPRKVVDSILDTRTSQSVPRSLSETFQVPLNDMYRYHQPWFHIFDHDRPRQGMTTRDNQSHVRPTSHKRRVRFNETVDVTSIPSRYQYSERIKQCMWTNQMELQEMSLRNYQEFEYEKYDWKQVILETQMYVDAITGTLIHPCHLTEPPA